jgi:hypothetical protein
MRGSGAFQTRVLPSMRMARGREMPITWSKDWIRKVAETVERDPSV